MAFDPGETAGDVGGFIKEHPVGIAVAVGAVILLIVLMSRGSGTPAATGSTDDSATQAAAQIQSDQVSANAQTALATIGAGVTNNQTAAAQTVALATIQGQNDATAAAANASVANAYYGAASHISDNNTASAIAMTQATAAEQIAGDQVISGEFSNLSDVLKNFGGTTQSLVNGLNTSTGTGLTGVMPSLIPLSNPDLSGLAAVGGQAGYYGAVTAINQANVNNGIATATNNAAIAGAVSQNATNAAAAVTMNANNAGVVNNAISTMTGWLNSLFGAFNTTAAAVAPKSAAPSQTSLQAANNALLGTPPQFQSASISQF